MPVPLYSGTHSSIVCPTMIYLANLPSIACETHSGKSSTYDTTPILLDVLYNLLWWWVTTVIWMA